MNATSLERASEPCRCDAPASNRRRRRDDAGSRIRNPPLLKSPVRLARARGSAHAHSEARRDPIRVQFPQPIMQEDDGRATLLSLSPMRDQSRQMAGFARCSRCNHALTSVHVEAVPALGALPAGSGIVIVACPNCRVPLGTSIMGPARTDARSRFHGASLAKTHSRPATVGWRDCTAIARRRGALRPKPPVPA